MAQMPPMQKPTSTRAASIHAMFCARAEAMFASNNRVSKPQRIVRRSRLPETITTSGANKAASNAGSEIISPALPVDVSRVSAIGVSRPTGSISVVTTEKVAMPTALTASHEWRTTDSEATLGDVPMVHILHLIAQAGLTRGALYHHFGDKKGLLLAVVEQIDAEMDGRLQAISDSAADLWEGFRSRCRAYLEMAQEPDIQRIVLRDARAVLGALHRTRSVIASSRCRGLSSN